MENYPAIRENEPRIHESTHAMTQRKLSDIMLNRRTQTQKSTFHMIPLTGRFQKANPVKEITACPGPEGNPGNGDTLQKLNLSNMNAIN